MALQFDQYNNQLKTNDSTNANAPLILTPSGTGAVYLNGTGQNLLLQSQTLNTSPWIQTATTINQTATVAPDGTTTGNSSIPTAVSSIHRTAQQFLTIVSGVTYTASVYAKAAGYNYLYMNFGTGSGSGFNAQTTFNISTGVVTTIGIGSATITSVGNGWYRCSVTGTATGSSSTTAFLQVNSTQTLATDDTFTGDGTSGIYLWGAQLEIGSVVNAYKVTTTTAIYNAPQLSFSGVAGLGLQSDGSLYVSPAGTGALQAQATTSSATGGNARGANAVDWQTNRASANQVASNLYGVLGGGQSNRSSGFGSVIAGGIVNQATATYSFVGGGNANLATGDTSVVVGGNSNGAIGYYNFIGGGYTNAGTSNSAVTTQTTTIAVTAGTTLYLSATNANIKVGQYVTGTGVSGQTYATSTVTTGTTAANTAFTSTGSSIAVTTGILTIGTLTAGTIVAGQVLTGTGVPAGTYIVSNISGGSASGSTWNTSTTTAVASTAITGTAYTFTISQAATTTAGITLSFYTPHGVVVGGGNNQATGAYSFIGGGGDAGTAANRNVASGTWSTVGGGVQNQATGDGSVISGGGYLSSSAISGNLASGTGAYIGAGYSCTASGTQSAIFNGYASFATGAFSFCGNGTYGTTRGIVGNHSFPASQNPLGSTAGACQSSLLNLGIITTTATPAVLTSNQNAASGTNQVILPNNAAYYFKVRVIAGVTGAGDTKAWTLEGAIKRGANAAATSIVGAVTTTVVATDAGAAAWTVTATADTTNGGLAITATGAAATTIRWVAKAETAEMTY
jgi:hypothetical protein